jgi:hypothetical protein
MVSKQQQQVQQEQKQYQKERKEQVKRSGKVPLVIATNTLFMLELPSFLIQDMGLDIDTNTILNYKLANNKLTISIAQK